MSIKYLSKTSNARARLASLRRMSPDDWRKARVKLSAESSGALGQGFNGEGRSRVAVWYTHAGEYFRNERTSDEVINLRHTGWFSDPDGDEKAQGIIASLPHGRFIAGYLWSMNGERVWFSEVFTDEKDAARMADEHARVMAETECEYQTRWQAKRELEDKIEASLKRLRECVALRHNKCMEYVRSEVAQLIRTIRETRQTLETKFADIE